MTDPHADHRHNAADRAVAPMSVRRDPEKSAAASLSPL
jgi:hypothetical protein